MKLVNLLGTDTAISDFIESLSLVLETMGETDENIIMQTYHIFAFVADSE